MTDTNTRSLVFWRLRKHSPQQQTARNSTAEALVCPITLMLPIDPVLADDGHIYERKAIEDHFEYRAKASLEIASPLTNQVMSQRLVSAPETKNLIASVIKERLITGDLAKAWTEQEKQRKRMEQALLKKAKQGNMKAMEYLIACYANGWGGFPQDQKMACGWARRAHAMGSVNGTALLGEIYLYGDGVEKDLKVGILYLSQASRHGSTFAAFVLQEAFVNGTLATN